MRRVKVIKNAADVKATSVKAAKAVDAVAASICDRDVSVLSDYVSTGTLKAIVRAVGFIDIASGEEHD